MYTLFQGVLSRINSHLSFMKTVREYIFFPHDWYLSDHSLGLRDLGLCLKEMKLNLCEAWISDIFALKGYKHVS